VVLNYYNTTVLKISKISISSGDEGERVRRDENVKGPGVTHK
jgi:hypothetical protein